MNAAEIAARLGAHRAGREWRCDCPACGYRNSFSVRGRSVWGGAIKLQAHDPALPLVVGEGIETAASAGIMLNAPAWSAISAGNLGGGLVLPAEVRSVVIAADPDGEGTSRARQAAARWTREGRHVRIARPRRGDFNDVLMAERNRHG